MEEKGNYTFYALLSEDVVVYVGRTRGKLRERINSHKRDIKTGMKKFDRYIILDEKFVDELNSKNLENYYILKYNPIYNRALNFRGCYGNLNEFCKKHNLDKKEMNKALRKCKRIPIFAENYNVFSLSSAKYMIESKRWRSNNG